MFTMSLCLNSADAARHEAASHFRHGNTVSLWKKMMLPKGFLLFLWLVGFSYILFLLWRHLKKNPTRPVWSVYQMSSQRSWLLQVVTPLRSPVAIRVHETRSWYVIFEVLRKLILHVQRKRKTISKRMSWRVEIRDGRNQWEATAIGRALLWR